MDPTTVVSERQARELKAVIDHNDKLGPGTSNRRVGRAGVLRMLRTLGWRGTSGSLDAYCRERWGREEGFSK